MEGDLKPKVRVLGTPKGPQSKGMPWKMTYRRLAQQLQSPLHDRRPPQVEPRQLLHHLDEGRSVWLWL